MRKFNTIAVITFIQTCIASFVPEEDSYNERFIQTFYQITDIVAIDAAQKAYEQQSATPHPPNENEALNMNETIELSNIFRDYVKSEMRIFVDQDLKDAASNINGDYYDWNASENIWLNQSSGHTLTDSIQAENENIDKLLELMDSNVLDLLDSSSQTLEKRLFGFLTRKAVPPTVPRDSSTNSPHNFDAAVHPQSKPPDDLVTFDGDDFYDAPQSLHDIPSPKPPGQPPGAPPKPKIKAKPSGKAKPYGKPSGAPRKPKFRRKFSNFLTNSIKGSKTLARIPVSVLQKSTQWVRAVYSALKFPIVRKFARYYIGLVWRKNFALRSSVRREAAEVLEDIAAMKRAGEMIMDWFEKKGYF